MRKLLFALLAASSLAVPIHAQQPWQLTRSTPATGLLDTSVFIVSDTAHRTRGATMQQVRVSLSRQQFDSLKSAGVLRVTGLSVLSGSANSRDSITAGGAIVLTTANDSILGTPVWGAKQTFATGQVVDSISSGARNGATATSQAAHDSSTKIATTLYVDRAVASGGGGGSTPSIALYGNADGASCSASSTCFVTPGVAVITGVNTNALCSQTLCTVMIPVAAQAKGICVQTSTTQPATGTQVFALQKNLSNTTLTVTVAANAGAGNFCSTGSVSFAAGDFAGFATTNNATSGGAHIVAWGIY